MRSTIKKRFVAVGAVVALAIPAGVAAATPSQGWTPTVLGKGTFEGPLMVNGTNIRAKFKQPSDFVMAEVDVEPGGTSGWHTHPGPALVIVKEGMITLYDGHDADCAPRVYGPGESFVDEGGDHVHIARNETDEPVTLLVTFIIPEGEMTFIDASDPGNCQF